MENYEFDFLVLGSGLAGLSTALHAAKFGNVGLVTKSKLDTSSSYFAQGGIAVVLSEEDSFESHYEDTLIAGDGLCKKEAVKILVEDGSARVKELIEMGMEFDKVDGKIVFGLEGAHSHNRVIHADGDATGRKVVEFLTRKVLSNKNISVFENTFVHKLKVNDSACSGFIGFNYLEKKNINFTSAFTMVASGGASAIYKRSTNPKSSTGDGIYLAYNAGAEVEGMEFVQFHPSSLVTDSDYTYLISEAVRGEGAYLINSKNERFMLGKHKKAELAPRDFVAYEIYKQWQIPNNKVFLTLAHLDADKIRKRFHNINLELKKHGLDIASDLIPVSPAAHYMIGGVKSGLNGETNISGLFVAGEVASTGIHGANRLASNSLLECLVFSKRAVDSFVVNKDKSILKLSEKVNFKINNNLKENFLQTKQNLSHILFEYIGIIREESKMKKFLEMLNDIENEFPIEENEYYSFQLKSLLTISRLMANSAIERKESRGAQKRIDFPKKNPKYEIEIVQQNGSELKYRIINDNKI